MKMIHKLSVLGLCILFLSCKSDDNGPDSGIDFLGYSWDKFNSGVFSYTINGTTLELELTQNAVWLNNDRGGMFHTLVDGDFDFRATVRATKRSNSSSPDDSFSFGGLIARDPNTGNENYVHLVAGTGDMAQGVPQGYEHKVTSDSVSAYQIIYDGNSEYDLRIVREGNNFTYYQRPAGSNEAEPWSVITFQPLTMSSEVQLGFNIYTGSTGSLADLKVTFSNISIVTP